MPIIPRSLNIFHRPSRTSSTEPQSGARTPPNASPLNEGQTRAPRRRGLLGRALPSWGTRANAQTGSSPEGSSRPLIGAAGSLTAPSTPQHPHATGGTLSVPSSPLHNHEVRYVKEFVDHTGLSDWSSQMFSQYRERSRQLGLANDFEQVRVYSRLKQAAGNLRSAVRMRSDSIQLNRLPIAALPDLTFDIAHLKKLATEDCDLHELQPEIENLFLLETLSLKGAKNLKALPDAVGRLPALSELTLRETGIKTLPPMGEASALQRLTIDNSPLEKLPTGFTALPQLVNLSLSDTKLRELPSSFGNLSALKTLSLQGNPKLESLPQSFGQLSGLQALTLTDNHIRALPSMRGASSLQTMTVAEAALEKLPADFSTLGNLAHLSLSDTKLRELPADIGNLQALKTLTLRNNEKLGALPASIKQLPHLEELTLSGNRFRELPSLNGASGLKTLTVENTSLASLPADFDALCKHLTQLTLSNTQLLELPASVGALSRLTSLTLTKNARLEALPDDSVRRLKNVQMIDLSDCPRLRTLPQSIGALSNLRTLDLSGCTSLTLKDLPHSVLFPHAKLTVTYPKHLHNDVRDARLKHDPRARLLKNDMERKRDEMDDAIFDTQPAMNEGQIMSVAFHIKRGDDRLEDIRRNAKEALPTPASNDSPLMQRALGRALNLMTSHEEFRDLRDAARSLPPVLQQELADLLPAGDGRNLVQEIGAGAYGVRGTTAIQDMLPKLANQIARDPEIMALREHATQYPRSNPSDVVAAKLAPLIRPLWENARALAPMPREVQRRLGDLLAAPEGRQLVQQISETAYSKRTGNPALRNQLAVLAAQVETDPRVIKVKSFMDRHDLLSPQQKAESIAQTLTLIVQELWDKAQAQAKKQGKAPMAESSGQR
ncbi:leucine-rich repeat domain-containing protein [Ralstonia solanacearum]|uniref:leucine-rich repeat domain-containing protein n=1 Tax=Ralstonia solanacearum TaxID=305 RepID=UPI000507C2CD|nr:leucine-rich repeat domain-containing protein [Ralstonia solanacearum]KFX77168.1 protein popC [Ralstonia solanacearum]OCQ66761.1 protein popC [Ralstonia solanacearum]